MFKKYESIKPQYESEEDGEFGKIFPEDTGFTAAEWASIPPIPETMKEVKCLKKYNKEITKALNKLLLSANFQQLSQAQKESISILKYGYVYEGHDCTDQAINNWLTEENAGKYKRLNWDVIERTYEKMDENWIKEEEEWAKGVGIELKGNWQYKKPRAQWAYWGRGYLGAHWSITL